MAFRTSHKLLGFVLLTSGLFAADRYQSSEPHMGSTVTITLYAESPDEASNGFVRAFRRIAELDHILSDYDPESELSQACRSTASASPDLLTILRYSQRISLETNGAFDITVGSLTKLWRAARREKRLLTDAEREAALSRTGFRKLTITGGRVRCAVPDMQLDAGGIAKGYAADEALAVLRKAGITRALVAMSGDIAAGDPPPGARGWKVKVLGEIRLLANQAVSTSGDEFQFLEVGGVRYSHILDPKTGYPLRNSRPVAVIAKTGIEADALDTAISVGGDEAASALKATHDVEILISQGPADHR